MWKHEAESAVAAVGAKVVKQPSWAELTEFQNPMHF